MQYHILSQGKVYFHPHEPFLLLLSLSLICDKSTFLHDGLIAIIDNCCVPIVVKHTLLATHVASLLLGALFNIILGMHVTSLVLGTSFNMNCSYRTLYLSIIASTQDCTSQIPKMRYCGLKPNRRICKYALITPLLPYIFV